MNNLPIPKEGSIRQGTKWSEPLRLLIQGKVLYFPDRDPTMVSGNLNREWMKKQGFRVTTRLKDGGTLAWVMRSNAK
jgi:hypothetical protein